MMNWMSVSKIRKLMMRSFQETQMVQLPSLLLTKMHQGQQQGILLHQCEQRGQFVYLFLFLAWWVIDRLLWKYVPKLCVSPNLATLEASRNVNVRWAISFIHRKLSSGMVRCKLIYSIPHPHLPHTFWGGGMFISVFSWAFFTFGGKWSFFQGVRTVQSTSLMEARGGCIWKILLIL